MQYTEYEQTNIQQTDARCVILFRTEMEAPTDRRQDAAL